MICLICRQAEIVDGSTTVHFESGEMRLTMSNVPARICPSCGEAYVAEDVAAKLLREAEKLSAIGEWDNVREYGAL